MFAARLSVVRQALYRVEPSSKVCCQRVPSRATVSAPTRLNSTPSRLLSSFKSFNTGINALKYHSRPQFVTQARNYTSFADIAYRPQTTPQTPYNEKIKSLVNQQQYQEAFSVFDEMTSNSVSPDESTFVQLALAMAHLNPKSSSDYLVKIADQFETVTRTHVPIKPGKSILSRLAQKMKTTVVEPPRAVVRSPIPESELYIEEEAQEEEEVAPTSFLESQSAGLSQIFKVWIEKKAPDVLIDFILNHHVKPRYYDIVMALEQCVKYRKSEEGWKVYRKWRETCPGPLVFHLAVVLCAEQITANGIESSENLTEKQVLERLHAINEDMAAANHLPTYQTQAFLLRHWGAVGRSNFAFNLFNIMLNDPYVRDSMRMSDYNVILNVRANKRDVEEAEKLFESLRQHPTLSLDATIYTTMVKVYARAGEAAKAWALVGEMVRHGNDPALYANQRHSSGAYKKPENDLWPTNVTMSILLDMEARCNGPLALIETFEAIRNTYHLTPSLNNWGALLEQLAVLEQPIALFDWFIAMMRTQSLRVTLRECCYLTLVDKQSAPFSEEQRHAVTAIKWSNKADLPALSNEERRKWIATVYRWKDLYLRNNVLSPPPELDLVALLRIRQKLSDPASHFEKQKSSKSSPSKEPRDGHSRSFKRNTHEN